MYSRIVKYITETIIEFIYKDVFLDVDRKKWRKW